MKPFEFKREAMGCQERWEIHEVCIRELRQLAAEKPENMAGHAARLIDELVELLGVEA